MKLAVFSTVLLMAIPASSTFAQESSRGDFQEALFGDEGSMGG